MIEWNGDSRSGKQTDGYTQPSFRRKSESSDFKITHQRHWMPYQARHDGLFNGMAIAYKTK